MPKIACYTLTWSPVHHAYKLHESQGHEALDIVPESTVWLMYLSEAPSFAFHGKHGSYTARKERKQRGGEYWCAYARVGGKLTKRYVGRDCDLTPARLEQVAQEFWCAPQAALRQKEARATSRSSPSASATAKVFVPDHASETPALSSDEATWNRKSGVGGRKPTVSPALSCLLTDPLLATKLHVPRPRPQLVHRPRLIQRLQQGMELPLTLLSAPAGFGKSTLLADWLASCAIPVAWLSLEAADNEPTRFLSSLIAALQTCDPQLGTMVQALLHPLHSPPLEAMLAMLLSDLDSKTVEHLVLVLEDYQVITAASIHHALSFLLDHLPHQVHLVLATRKDPPLPLARLRGQGALVELRAADLQFTQEETAAYLVEVMGLPLSAEQSALLQARTEGWITGLHLAALSLQGHDDQAGFITAFSGSHRYVVDYLLEEVLSRQPPGIQDFLLQTCILDRLSAPLCDAVCATSDSQAQLDFLERANLFLIPLDDERQWYRYHHLFAQVLRQRLQQTVPTLIPILHRRASHWYEQHERFAEAVPHALAASACEEAARLIEQSAERFVSGSQMQTLCEWLHTLPEHLVLAHPALCLMHAMALMYTNQWEAALTRLQVIERSLGPGEGIQDMHRRVRLGQLIACWSMLARLSGDLEQCVALARQALDLLPEVEDTPLTRVSRAVAMLSVARAYLVSGDVTPASEHWLAEIVAFTRTSSNYQMLTFRTLTLLARLQVLQGQLHQAAATYEEAAQVVPRAEELQVVANGPVYYFGLGDLLREWNDLEAAEQHLAEGMNQVQGTLSVDADEVWRGYAAMARLQHARGRDDQALATLDAFLRLVQHRHVAPVLLAQVAALRAYLELAQGHLHAAAHWLDASGLSATDAPSYPREQEYLILARVRIAEARITSMGSSLLAVLDLLARLLAEAEANRRMHSVLEILVLRALALHAQGDRTGALATLEHALRLAEPEGYIRLFADEGAPMLALLRQAHTRGILPGYVATLLSAFSRQYTSDTASRLPHLGSLVEPLTARERDVLQLVLDGASNREIACRLVLSVGTVKKHVSNICGKLNVQRRTQAIARARTLRLL
jgi:LuxR family transcriptional regulator, maltose regulon positive regulatory protein